MIKVSFYSEHLLQPLDIIFQEAKDPFEKAVLDGRQLALKVYSLGHIVDIFLKSLGFQFWFSFLFVIFVNFR